MHRIPGLLLLTLQTRPTDSQSIAKLLNRAGFTLPTVDVDEIAIRYPSLFELCDDLRAMGEANAALHRRPFMHRDSLLASAAIYHGALARLSVFVRTCSTRTAMHGFEDGSVPATFSLIHAIGWAPAETQPKPLARGSATKSLKDVLGDGTAASEKE